MSAKKHILDFLEGKGASQEEMQAFGQLYDKEVNDYIKIEAKAHLQEQESQTHKAQSDIAKLAEQASIR